MILAAAAALSFTLASCSNDSGDGEATTDGGSSAEETTDAAAEETTEAAEDDAAASGGAACLIGSWEMTPDAMEEQVLAAYGGEGEVTAEGTVSLTFDEDSLSQTSDNSASYSVEMEGTTIEGSSEANGSMEIAYTADDTTITYGEVLASDGGTTISSPTTGDIEVTFADAAAALNGTTMTYTCSDAELTTTTAAGGVELVQTYTRA